MAPKDDSLRTWKSENCEEFREMQIVRHAKYVGTIIGPDGHHHRWSAPRKIIQRVLKISASTKSLVERLCDFKIFEISVLSFIGSVCASDRGTLKTENHALQPYNAFPSTLLGVGSVCGLGPNLVGIHSISLVAACSTTLSQGLEKTQYGSWTQLYSYFLLFLLFWETEFSCSFYGLLHRGCFLILFVVWTGMTH